MKTITKELLSIQGVSDVEIDNEAQKITLNAEDDLRKIIVDKLYKLGYPETGQNNLIEKAKSYVSCAIGRMS